MIIHREKEVLPERFKAYNGKQLFQLPQIRELNASTKHEMAVVSSIFPFRVNSYVIDELIDWNDFQSDPIFKLTFPHREMLRDEHFNRISKILLAGDSDNTVLQREISAIRLELNPHPAGQTDLNVPMLNGKVVQGVQHKYPETVLFFPSAGQVCHSYCTFCFRWAQFVGEPSLKIATRESHQLVNYLKAHTEVTDVLVTGGDPLVMSTDNLEAYLNPLLSDQLEHIRTIRIGSKALTFWPQRFVSDADADDLLRLFERIIAKGKHVALMAHYNHWHELETSIARKAIKRIRAAGVEIRSQGPLLKGINDESTVWAKMWQTQVELGIIPYYMFVARDTGAQPCFEISLHRASNIYKEAIKSVSGLARTVRGPSMSTTYGKIEIQDVSSILNEQVFVLRFLQARNTDHSQRTFFAKYDEKATWLDQLQPAFGEKKFFFDV